MKSAPFSYSRPESVAEAVATLAADRDAVALAGGQSLLGLTAMRRRRPSVLVDLDGLADELGHVTLSGRTLRIGALVRQGDLLADPLVGEHAAPLAAAARLVGVPQVRNRGTIGGALAHADPVAELPAVLAALGAVVHVLGPAGERDVGVAELAAGPQQPRLAPGELVVGVSFDVPAPGAGWAVEEVGARFAARPLVVAVAVARERPIVVVAGIGARPEIVVGAERPGTPAAARPEAAIGAEPLGRRIAALAPIDDPRASLTYRVDVATTLAERVLRRATAGPRAAPDVRGAVVPPPGRRRSLAPAETVDVTLEVNGASVRHRLAARTLLSELVREELRLTGTHVGCEHGVCGACNVLLDGLPVRSCLVLAAQADGRTVTTVEGLRDAGRLDDLLREFAAAHALQCGFCTPGMLVTLAAGNVQSRGRDELAEALVGNLCRCTGYRPILDAAEAAAR